MSNLKGKVALITGSSSGIGAATAVLLASRGCAVSIHGRNQERLKQVEKDCITAGLSKDKVVSTIGDIGDNEVQAKLVENTLKLGSFDILINNAGIGTLEEKGGMCSIYDDMEVYDRIMSVNLRSVVSLTKLCLPHLEKSKGAIVNVSSVGGIRPVPPFTYYCMAKAALDHFTRCLAAELGCKGIRVNSVNPGSITTNFVRRFNIDEATLEAMKAPMIRQHALGREGTPEEVAKLIVYLSSDDSSFTTGQLHVIDGGYLVNYRTD